MASPFNGKTFTFTQPDGTKFEVRGWGDQHHATFETPEGYSVVKNPATGFFEIAQLSSDETTLEAAPGPQGNLDGAAVGAAPRLRISREAARARGREGALRFGGRRCDERCAERKSLAHAARVLGGPLLAPPHRQTVGDFVGLCILIDFDDVPGTIPLDEVERFCNQNGYSGFGNNGSVSDYFHDNSLGRCRYTNVVTAYYRAQHPKTHYTDPNIEYGLRARQLIVEALTHLTNNNFDFSALTADSGGFVYAMNVYYAGGVVNNWSEGLWPHAHHIGTAFQVAPGKRAFDYQFTDMGHELTLGTFCHENGHMLCDYPDLYDYGGESSGEGAYCLMCAGGNINDKNPTHISAYLKRLSGWAASVKTIQHNEQIVLTAGKNEFAMFTKNTGEYFILENRVKSGRDVSLPSEGLTIWHVDEDGNNSDEQMTPGNHYELSLEQADGHFRLENLPNQFGDTTDLYGQVAQQFDDTTTPGSKWWDGTASNLDIFNIVGPGDSVSFEARLFEDDDNGGGPTEVTAESAPGVTIPDNRADGLVDTIDIDDDMPIASVKVMLDIAHTYRGDLRITLFAPSGDAIVLHHRHQGGSDDHIQRTIDESEVQALATLHGQSTKGEWRLLIQDLAPFDVGTLNSWGLEFTAAGQPSGPVVLEEAPGTHIPDDDSTGIEQHLPASTTGSIANVEVSVDITHTWIGDLLITLRSPDGTDVVLHDQEGGNDDDVVKTYTAATTPGLASLAGESINGDWQLRVADHVGQDFGKLNNWKVVIQPAS